MVESYLLRPKIYWDAYQPFFLIVAALAVLGMVVAFVLMKPPTLLNQILIFLRIW